MTDQLIQTDVTVIGGGLAGMASSIHLAKAGLNVLCLEPALEDTSIVGESLDWSAPELLRGLGLPVEQLISEGIATWKCHVILQLGDGSTYRYVPGNWLGRAPWNVELRTLHVDRTLLKKALTKILLQQGVRLMDDRVNAVDQHSRKVTALTTQRGKRISSSFYVDASGFAASLFPRLFHRAPLLPHRLDDFGRRHVADADGMGLNRDLPHPVQIGSLVLICVQCGSLGDLGNIEVTPDGHFAGTILVKMQVEKPGEETCGKAGGIDVE